MSLLPSPRPPSFRFRMFPSGAGSCALCRPCPRQCWEVLLRARPRAGDIRMNRTHRCPGGRQGRGDPANIFNQGNQEVMKVCNTLRPLHRAGAGSSPSSLQLAGTLTSPLSKHHGSLLHSGSLLLSGCLSFHSPQNRSTPEPCLPFCAHAALHRVRVLGSRQGTDYLLHCTEEETEAQEVTTVLRARKRKPDHTLFLGVICSKRRGHTQSGTKGDNLLAPCSRSAYLARPSMNIGSSAPHHSPSG